MADQKGKYGRFGRRTYGQEQIDNDASTRRQIGQGEQGSSSALERKDSGGQLTTDGVVQALAQKYGRETTTHVSQQTGPLVVGIALDATGSMEALIENARRILGDVMRRVQEEIPSAKIEFVIVAFRDYHHDGRDLLQVSEQTGEYTRLVGWLEHVHAFGGDDFPEAVEHALKHILLLKTTPDIVILAGDAPGHTAGEIPTYDYITDRRTARQVAIEYGQRNVPIYALVVNNLPPTVADFEAIAIASGGASGKLDGSDAMLQMISMAILKKLGGREAVTRFVGKQKQLTEGVRAFSGKLLTSGR